VVNWRQKWFSTIRKIISPPRNAKTNERKIEFMKNRNTITIWTTILLACFGLLPKAEAALPAPDGGYGPPAYGQGNTAEGQNALLSLTTGTNNTAVGWFSLKSLTTGQYNTAIGAGALYVNTADLNTATGGGALWSNTSGASNTANGFAALFSNTDGDFNTAIGDRALFSNTTGDFNTANGYKALHSNSTGIHNTAIGLQALLRNTTGSGNTALGGSAGASQTTGSGNVYIGHSVGGAPGESDRTRIRNIGSTPIVASGITVMIQGVGGTGDQILGYNASSRRYKQDIKPMDNASERLLALKPVIFRAKGDPTHLTHYGLIAEDVAKVNPDLAGYNADGQPETVRYDAVNAMLLNEFLKEHRKVQELEKQVERLTAGLQQVSDQLEVRKAKWKVALNNP
jgi:hypothetical protein